MAEYFIAEELRHHVAGRAVTDDVSPTLKKDELAALIGPNDAGKSTLLRLLIGLLKPAAGCCMLSGKPLGEWSTQKPSRHWAMMCRQTQLGFDWPVEAVIAMGRVPWSQRPKPGLIAQVTEMTGCMPLAGRRYTAFSGGEQQRVQLTRTLAQLWHDSAPRGWLFFDEPASTLDLYHQQHLLRMLKTLTASGGLYVCIILHDLNLAVPWADRIVLLYSDRLVLQGTSETVLRADDLKHWCGVQIHADQHPTNVSPQVFLTP